MLRTCEVVAILEAGLNVAVKNICQDGKFDLEKYARLSLDYSADIADRII